MTKDYLISKIRYVIKQSGVGGFYIFFEEGVRLTDGTIINEVRLKSKSLGIEVLEKGTNRVISRLSKKDVALIHDLI